ncbi:icarapin-like [Linepithema humile]|uniref:icarapin-like n=1 Tax=Linepithema humile TaxID=83485 RepID=UPI00062346A7|nr:PREDICTED: icarapin-like [Linepithema humile]
MKVFVHVSLIAACLIACAHGLPGARRDSLEDDLEDTVSFDFAMPNFFAETVNRLRQNLLNYFWNMPDITNIDIPEGANTTSTTKIIDGHVVTINETTYTSGDETSGTSFRIRIIDVKPQNETIKDDRDDTIPLGGDVTPKAQPGPAESAETVEEFNNEIPKSGGGDTLTA